MIASDGTTADSRVFEDIMVQSLQAAGVAAIPGYTTVPPDARRAEAPFAAAVAATGADGVILVRLIRVDTKTQVSTMMMPGPMVGPWGGFYGGGFYGGGFYAVPEVTQYDVASVETNVYAVASRTLVWAATTQTVNPTNDREGSAELREHRHRAAARARPAAAGRREVARRARYCARRKRIVPPSDERQHEFAARDGVARDARQLPQELAVLRVGRAAHPRERGGAQLHRRVVHFVARRSRGCSRRAAARGRRPGTHSV